MHCEILCPMTSGMPILCHAAMYLPQIPFQDRGFHARGSNGSYIHAKSSGISRVGFGVEATRPVVTVVTSDTSSLRF